MSRIEYPPLKLVAPARANLFRQASASDRADLDQQPSWTTAARAIFFMALTSWGILLTVLRVLF